MIDTLSLWDQWGAYVKTTVAAITALSLALPAAAEKSSILIAQPLNASLDSTAKGQVCALRLRLNSAFSLGSEVQVYERFLDKGSEQASNIGDEVDLALKISARKDKKLDLTLTTDKSNKTILIDPKKSIEAQIKPVLPSAYAHFFDQPRLSLNEDQILKDICTGSSTIAYENSGLALSLELIRQNWLPPSTMKQGLLVDWARGRALLRNSKPAASIRHLRKTVLAMESVENAPSWYRKAQTDTVASAVSFINDTPIVFEEGHFTALNPHTGKMLWRIKTGPALPQLIEAGDEKLIAVTQKGLLAFNQQTGAKQWFLKLQNVADEIVVTRKMLYAAGPRLLLAAKLKDGSVQWRKTSTARYRAGPVLFSNSLAIPLETRIDFIDLNQGNTLRELSFSDEISGPLVLGSPEQLWVLIGGKRVAVVENTLELQTAQPQAELTPKPKFWIQNAMGVEWPPYIRGNSLFIAARHSRRGPFVARLNIATKQIKKKVFWGGAPPLKTLSDFRSFAYLGKDKRTLHVRENDGKQRWKQRLDSGPHQLRLNSGLLWATNTSEILAFEQTSGKLHTRVVLDEPIVALAVKNTHAVAIVESGAIYGFSTHRTEQWTYWLREARLDLAEAYIAVGQRRRAQKLIREVLSRTPALERAEILLQIEAANKTRGGAILALLKFQKELHPYSTGRKKLEESLKNLIGLEHHWPTEKPIAKATLVQDHRVIIQTTKDTYSYTTNPAIKNWTITGSAAVSLGAEALLIKQTIFEPRSGSKIGSLNQRQYTPGSSDLYTLTNTSISMQTPNGQTKWEKRIESAHYRLLGQSSSHLVLASPVKSLATQGEETSSTETRVEVRSKKNGQLLWVRPFTQAFTKAYFSNDYLLLQSMDKLIGLSSKNGATQFQAKLPPNGVLNVLSDETSWLLQTPKKLMRLAAGNGRVIGTYRFKKPPRSFAYAKDAQTAFIVSGEGSLFALDLKRMREAGRIQSLKFSGVSAGSQKILAISEKRDETFLFNAAQKLSPRP